MERPDESDRVRLTWNGGEAAMECESSLSLSPRGGLTISPSLRQRSKKWPRIFVSFLGVS
jgi:hypothetical protein